jgi:hypothetical protein
MKYLNITQTCKLFNYQELKMWRVESWLDETGIYECYWFYSNDGLIPNTIKHHDY